MKKQLLKVPVLYGSAASALIMILIVVLFYIDRHPLGIPIFLDIRLILFPLFMFLALKDFRDNKNNKELRFWQGFLMSTIIGVLVATLVSLFILVFNAVEPDFFADFITRTTGFIESRKALVQEEGELAIIQEQLDNLPLTRPYHLAVDYFLKTTPFTLVWGFIISIVLRKTT